MKLNISSFLIILSMISVVFLLSGCASGSAKKALDVKDSTIDINNECTDNGGTCVKLNRDCSYYNLVDSNMSCSRNNKKCCVEEPVINYTCSDTDGGLNYYTEGTATSTYNGVRHDLCEFGGENESHILSEAYCDGYEAAATTFDCYDLGDYICEGGKCVINPNMNGTNGTNMTNQTLCVDTDGGQNFDVRGICTDDEGHMYTDSCNSNVFGRVNEAYCNGENNCHFQAFDVCTYGCENGACLDENPMDFTVIASGVDLTGTYCEDIVYDGGNNPLVPGTIEFVALSGINNTMDEPLMNWTIGNITYIDIVLERYCEYTDLMYNAVDCTFGTECNDVGCYCLTAGNNT